MLATTTIDCHEGTKWCNDKINGQIDISTTNSFIKKSEYKCVFFVKIKIDIDVDFVLI